MSLIRRNGFLPSLRTGFPELFDVNNLFETTAFGKAWLPRVNILENEHDYQIEVAAPGLTKKDFHVSIENGTLTISSERKDEKKDVSDDYTYREFSLQSFSRSFTLPEGVEKEDIKAKYADGILKVNLHKTAEAVREKAKEISVA